MDYDSKAFSINEDYGLDNIRFNKIFCREKKWNEEEKEEEFKLLFKFNKIDLANDSKFNDFYIIKHLGIYQTFKNVSNIYQTFINDLKFGSSLKDSIKLDNSEFVYIILQNSGIELGKFPILDLIRLYEEVRIVFS
jgi:hypothetical protein